MLFNLGCVNKSNSAISLNFHANSLPTRSAHRVPHRTSQVTDLPPFFKLAFRPPRGHPPLERATFEPVLARRVSTRAGKDKDQRLERGKKRRNSARDGTQRSARAKTQLSGVLPGRPLMDTCSLVGKESLPEPAHRYRRAAASAATTLGAPEALPRAALRRKLTEGPVVPHFPPRAVASRRPS